MNLAMKSRYETQPSGKLPNVKINLTDKNSINNISTNFEVSTSPKTTSDSNQNKHSNSQQSILDKLRRKHGYKTNRNFVKSERSKPYANTQ